MKSYQIKVPENKGGQRIDRFLSALKEIPSRSFAQKLINSGSVIVNDKVVNKSYSINEGDNVSFTLPEPEKIDVIAQNIPLKIYYQDKDLAVVEKPAGMVTHPSYGHWEETLVNALLFHLKDLSAIGGILRPGIIHRLDKDTSGLLIVAKNDNSHLKLSRELKERSIKRRYMALVHGHLKENKGKIEMPISRSFRNRKKMAIDAAGKVAITEFKVEESYNAFDLLEVSLMTGRTHQIRVHMAAIGHPVVGDDVFGSKNERSRFPLNRYFLHAFELEFIHPVTGKEMYFLSPLPIELKEYLDSLKAGDVE
jgi:23S rRNA pseudouridine1911/1915/1917 synthase